MARTVIDPVTRVGGHLRIEVNLAGGEVRDAWSSGTMFRGVERVLHGRDPRDAWLFAQRICGTCTGVHALASVRAVETALGLTIPANARLLRNLLAATMAIRDHVVQFYVAQLPDWVDAKAALGADPAATSSLARSLGPWPQSSTEHFASVRDRLAAVVDGGGGAPFASGWWGHPAYRLSPEQDLLLVAHALDALDWQRDLLRINSLIGGKDPHPQAFLVGGMVAAPLWGGPVAPGTHPTLPDRNAPMALSEAGLTDIHDLLAGAQAFAEEVLLPDVELLARTYPEWTRTGSGVGRFLSFGEFPEQDGTGAALYLPQGRVSMPGLAVVGSVDQADVTETVAHAWYEDPTVAGGVVHPADGETRPRYAGPALPITTLEGSDRYSWIKAPRYDGVAMETGPLARLLVAYTNGHADTQVALGGAMTRLGLGRDGVVSTMGRIVAKAVETRMLAAHALVWMWALRQNLGTGDLSLADLSRWDPGSWPSTAEGYSLGEGPRGAVGHWVTIRDGLVDRYQVVDASTWNASPRDGTGSPGPIEQALLGTPVADPAQPLEILRTVHSFDPCTACAVHALGRPGSTVTVRAGHPEVRP